MAQENRKSLGRYRSHNEHHYKEDPKVTLEDSWSGSNEDDHEETNEACLMAVGSQSWKTRILLYVQGKDNGEMLIDSIENGTFKLAKEITVKADDGTDITRKQTPDDLAHKDRLRYDSEGHIAKKCTTNKKVKDSEWFIDKMLLAQAQEARVALNEEDQEFLADRLEENDDYCDDETTANAIFMASFSSAGSLNDDRVALTYDSNTLYELPHYDTCLDDDMPNLCNVISYAEYMVTIEDEAA
ncbi:hypothetical protein Tco_0224107 [Tanacetum coccineum]